MNDPQPTNSEKTVQLPHTGELHPRDDVTEVYQTDGLTIPESTFAKTGMPEISGYVITSEIAKGGMGRIYAAHDLTLDREVAIKTLLPGANAERFITEAKITAKLPHPCIPPIYALGTLSNGGPFLAMKFIRGRTLAAELAKRPSMDAELPRLIAVFEQIAQAVGFAHSRGIVHRDLKPLNVMVGEFGEVQVMDWGLAKELGEPHSNDVGSQGVIGGTRHHAAQTVFGSVMGTPGYMAPEQARGEAVDARADVFALGATLVAILTGLPAFTGSTVKESLDLAANGKLDDVFARLAKCGQDPELVALARRCLAANPNDRPQDGQVVAEEVAAYRAGVEERLHRSETEKAEAVVRELEGRKRRQQMMGAGLAIVLTLLIGLTASLWQMRRAVKAEEDAVASAAEARSERDAKEQARLAEQQRADGERIAKEQAERLLQYARRGNEILGAVFTSLDPAMDYQSIGQLRDVLKGNLVTAIRHLDEASIDDPLQVAELQETLGLSLLGLGDFETAIPVLEKAYTTRAETLGPHHLKTLGSLGNLAEGYRLAGKSELALPLYQQTLEQAKKELGPNHIDTLTSMNNLAVGYLTAGKTEQALPLFEETLQLRRQVLGVEHPDTLVSMSNLSSMYYSLGQFDKAIPLFEETVEIMKQIRGPEHIDTLTSMNNLAAAYFKSGSFAKSIPLFETSLQHRRLKLGVDHPDTLSTLKNLGIAHSKMQQGDLASEVFLEYSDLQRKRFPDNDPSFASILESISNDLIVCQELETAEKLLRESLAIREMSEPDQWSTFNAAAQLGGVLLGQKRFPDAEPLLIRGYEGMKARKESIPSASSGRLAESLDLLILLFEVTEREEELKKYQAEREKDSVSGPPISLRRMG